MPLTHTFSRDDEANAHMRRVKVDQMQANERAESSRIEFAAQLNDGAGSSRRLLHERAGSSRLLLPPSWLIHQHSPECVGPCPNCGYAYNLPYSGYDYEEPYSMNMMQEATSAPACTNALVTWQGNTCQGGHTTHYHHHYYHHKWQQGPIGSSHACNATASCLAMNSPHDFCSHEGPPINCPVDISAPSPIPATPAPVPTGQSKRFARLEKHVYAAEEALSFPGYSAEAAPPSVHAAEAAISSIGYAAEAEHTQEKALSSIGYVAEAVHAAEEALFFAESAPRTLHATEEAPVSLVSKAAPPPPPYFSRHLPPFPSSRASPYVLCQHCSRLLLLPRGTLLSPSPGTAHLDYCLFVKLKCSYCLKISKLSTRHIHRASTSPFTEDIYPPVSPPPTTQKPVEAPSMPSCTISNGVMQEAPVLNHSKTEESLDDIFDPSLKSDSSNSSLLINGNVEQDLMQETGAPLNGLCKHISNQNNAEMHELLIDLCGDWAQCKSQETGSLGDGQCMHTREINMKTVESSVYEDLSQSEAVLGNGKCMHTQGIAINSGDSCICEDLVQTGAPLNGNCALTQEIVMESAEPFNGICEDLTQPNLETSRLINGSCEQTAKDKGDESGLYVVSEEISDHKENAIGVQEDNGTVHESEPDREQGTSAFSSVQDWVDSICLEMGYESDNQLQEPLNCLNDSVDGLEKFPSSQHRSPLHQHFGYGSPSELFEKILFSEGEEIKARTGTNSRASSSFSSTNPCQSTETKSPSTPIHSPSLRRWTANSCVAIGCSEQDHEGSLTGLLKRSVRRGGFLSASPKSRVIVNGHALSSAAVKQAEERAGRLRPGSYWYDCKAGFWGVEGGPCLGILPPNIEQLSYPLTRHCSNGDTQVYVNGRELHIKDLTVLAQRGMSQKAGRAYALGFEGVLVDETTGLEIQRLGKLAPTVERKGKGYGMFSADVLQSKAPAVHRNKPAK